MRRGLRCTLSTVLALAVSAGTVWSLESATRAQPVSKPAQQPAVSRTDTALVAQLSRLQGELDASAGGSLAVRSEIIRLRALLAARRHTLGIAASAPVTAGAGWPGPAQLPPGSSHPVLGSTPPVRPTGPPTRAGAGPVATPSPTSTWTEDGGGGDD